MKGQVAAEIQSADELVLTEMLFNGGLQARWSAGAHCMHDMHDDAWGLAGHQSMVMWTHLSGSCICNQPSNGSDLAEDSLCTCQTVSIIIAAQIPPITMIFKCRKWTNVRWQQSCPVLCGARNPTAGIQSMQSC